MGVISNLLAIFAPNYFSLRVLYVLKTTNSLIICARIKYIDRAALYKCGCKTILGSAQMKDVKVQIRYILFDLNEIRSIM